MALVKIQIKAKKRSLGTFRQENQKKPLESKLITLTV